jgi:hypothetical protein
LLRAYSDWARGGAVEQDLEQEDEAPHLAVGAFHRLVRTYSGALRSDGPRSKDEFESSAAFLPTRADAIT